MSGVLVFIKWLFDTWLPARGQQVLNELVAKIGTERIDLASVGVEWSRINQWVPLNETVGYITKFFVIFAAIVVLKWVRKLLPFA